MGSKLVSIYEEIAKEGEMLAKINLAKETKIPSTKAALEPDTPQNIELFRQAYKKITGKECGIK